MGCFAGEMRENSNARFVYAVVVDGEGANDVPACFGPIKHSSVASSSR